MKLLRSRKVGCLVILIFLIQLSLLYWVFHDFVYDQQKLPDVMLEAREDGGKEPINVDHPSKEEVVGITSQPYKITPNPPSNTQSRADVPLQELQPSHKPQNTSKKPPSSPPSSSSSSSVTTPQTVYWTGPEQLAEKSSRSPRKLSPFEAKGN